MFAIAHEARLAMPANPKDPESLSVRENLTTLRDRAVRTGDARLAESYDAQLAEPEYPAHIEYLREWSQRLFGRSGIGMGAIAPLSDQQVFAWMFNTGHRATPDEIEALMLLDAVRRDPSIATKARAAREALASTDDAPSRLPADRPSPASRWPQRKATA